MDLNAESGRQAASLFPDSVLRLDSVLCPTPKVSPAGHARSFGETEDRLRPLLDRVPITRVYDATPVDVLGLPVWCAVTPLAADLTVHAGKGATAQAARLSAIMEGIERTCAEFVSEARTVHASFRALTAAAAGRDDGIEVIDPETFDLPFDTRYRPDRDIRWVPGLDLCTGATAYVPRDLVVSPAPDGIGAPIETNGMAAGNTLTEAVVHALYEVVERHAVSAVRFYDLYHDPVDSPPRPARMIDVSTLPPAAADWAGRIRREGLDVVVRDATDDELGIPVFIVYVTDDSFPGAEGETIAFAGYGADLDPAQAVFRAVTEAVQSHSGTMLGARDTFEGEGVTTDRTAVLLRHVSVLHPDGLVPFPGGGAASADLCRDLRELLDRLRRAGFEHCVAVDLTRADLGVPVVRVLVPGLAPPYAESVRRPGVRLLGRII
jgi:YcaO-like protein with predicted kinase domain